MVVAFRVDDTPEIIFVADTEHFKCPPHYVYAAALIGASFHDITDTLAGLELPHEQAVERLACILLTGLGKLVYETRSTDSRLMKFASLLEEFALKGIVAGITASAKQPPEKPSLQPFQSPSRN